MRYCWNTVLGITLTIPAIIILTGDEHGFLAINTSAEYYQRVYMLTLTKADQSPDHETIDLDR